MSLGQRLVGPRRVLACRLTAGYGVLLAMAAMVVLPLAFAGPAAASAVSSPAQVTGVSPYPSGVAQGLAPTADDTFDRMASFAAPSCWTRTAG